MEFDILPENKQPGKKILVKYWIGKYVKFKITLFIWYPFPKRLILDSAKLKRFADDNFKLDENGGKFFKLVENTVGKWEIVCYEQFLLFLQCF